MFKRIKSNWRSLRLPAEHGDHLEDERLDIKARASSKLVKF